MKETFKLIMVLALICAVAGCLLAWVQKVTYGPIQETERRVKNEAMKEVLPEHDNDPLSDMVEIKDGDKVWIFNVARQGSNYVGAAFESTTAKGYGGNITIMAGINASGKVEALKILKQKETPGLGAKISDPEWRAQFAGKDIASTIWAVKKDQGDIDHITAATISSRAVTEAVKDGLDVYTKNRSAIAGADTQGGGE